MKILIVSFLALVSTSCSETTTPHTQVQEAETSNLTPSYAYSGLHPAYQPSTHQPQPAYQPSPSYVGVGVGAANQYQDPYYQAGYGTYYQHSTPKYTETSQESGLVRTMATVLSAVRQSFAVFVKVLGKIGLVVSAGAVVLVIGGALTALLCNLTPYCTLTFMGYGLSKDEVRSFMTPDNINMVGSLLGQAVEKYNDLQKTVEVKNV